MARNAIAAVSIALLSLGAATAAHAQNVRATVVIGAGAPHYYQGPAPVGVQYQAPPPPRYEAMPRPRRGMAWVPGHWEWRGHRHVWQQGHWIKARAGYHYREPRWVERGGRWNMQPGGWDRDRDGVPNRYDRRPDNPYRR
ncbi:YXWGXW repeat-containing protein [Acidovorax sp.]|uniref:YXWGXW repeat-containing protein n=1 Tax=Acidovorax sp. TaxID=1872122 RepID=UPI00260F031C|nr:YXWGXW repeat-containing protein [Acidovorax sp.]